MKATLRDTKLYFDIEGAGLIPDGSRMKEKSVAILLHGGPGADHSSYKPLFSALKEELQLIYLDHRGQGRSQRGKKETYTLDNNVEDLEALRLYLGLEKIILIGGSYGGMVALTYASRYPEQVEGLIAIATAGSYHFLERAQANLAHLGTPEQQAIAEYLWQGNFKDDAHLRQYFQIMAPLYSLTYDPTSTTNSFKRTILSVDAINIAFSTFLRSFNILEQLPNIKAPTLIIGADSDWICPPECSQEIAQQIPHATLKIFENCGHLVRVDQPERLIKEIRAFLQLHSITA